jgi:four helix bundle protein
MRKGDEVDRQSDFRGSAAWQAAHELALEIYRVTDDWPREDVRGLANEIRESAVIAASKMAAAIEVEDLKVSMDYASVARESLGLVRTYLHVAEGLGFIDEAILEQLMTLRDSAAQRLRELERSFPNEKTNFDSRDWFDMPSSSN